MRAVLHAWLWASILRHRSSVWWEERGFSPFLSKTTVLEMERRILERLDSVAISDWWTRAVIWAWRKKCCNAEFVVSTWMMFVSAGQINLLVRELCFCKHDALGIFFFFFLHLFSNIVFIFLGLICCCSLLCTLLFRAQVFGLLWRVFLRSSDKRNQWGLGI